MQEYHLLLASYQHILNNAGEGEQSLYPMCSITFAQNLRMSFKEMAAWWTARERNTPCAAWRHSKMQSSISPGGTTDEGICRRNPEKKGNHYFEPTRVNQ